MMQANEVDVDSALKAAVCEHRSGNLVEATRLYRGILAARPEVADASYNLGVLALQTGELGAALGHFQAALQTAPRQPRSWLSCIDTLIRLGQTVAATEMLTQARRCGLTGAAAEALASRLRTLSQRPSVVGTSWMPNLSGAPYVEVLERLHGVLRPKTYLEIGVETGATLAIARCAAIGIDPRFQFGDIEVVRRIVAKPSLLLYQMPSDEFFGRFDPVQLLGSPIDFAFLDGMHRCEYLLRDFLNVERHCRPDAVIALHDCLPLETPMAEREPNVPPIEAERQGMWTGDVWRTALLLKRHRPELRLMVLDAAPTGLVLITGLDPRSKYLAERQESLVSEMLGWSLEQVTLLDYYKEIAVEPEIYFRRPADLLARLRRGSPGDASPGRGMGISLVRRPVAAPAAGAVAEISRPSSTIAGFPAGPQAAAFRVEATAVPAVGKKNRKRGQRARDREAGARLHSWEQAPNAVAEEQPAKGVDGFMELYNRGRYGEAEAFARALIARFPGQGFGWKALGGALQKQERLEEALAAKLESVRLLPDDIEAYNNLGTAYIKLDRPEQAEAAYRAALALQPEYPTAISGLGITLQKLGRLAEAEAHCRRALELRPIFADASNNLGIVLYETGRFVEAEASYRQALEADPVDGNAWNNLGITLQKLNRLTEAMAAHGRAIELQPSCADAYINLAGCLQQQGRSAEAEACYRRAIEIAPEQMHCYSNRLFSLCHNPRMTAEALFAEHVAAGARFESRLRAGWRPHPNSPDPERLLEVGFVSGDFCTHAMAHYLLPVFEHLAHQSGLRLHAYASNALEDRVTERLRACGPRWTRVYGVSDERLAAQIRADGIDILVDLSGYTGGHRAPALARKPAPIQCGWIGYLGTSGMKCMDYYLADGFYLPGECDRFFTERIVRLAVVAPFEPNADAPRVGPLPALANGHITFGSFSRMGKLGPEVAKLWSELLQALPDARLLIGALAGPPECETVLGWFAALGIAPKRIDFHLGASMGDYLKLHHRVDMCLDPFPFTGATTTCHAMWMGVPTLTLEGRSAAGRLGPAMLRHAGLEGFVASTGAEFVAKGASWARDLEALATLRGGMRKRFRESPLGRPAEFAVDLAGAFRGMWRDWCERDASVMQSLKAGIEPRA
jgi:protein O-GlcNAc transferase